MQYDMHVSSIVAHVYHILYILSQRPNIKTFMYWLFRHYFQTHFLSNFKK